MRHNVYGKHLGRNKNQREALFKGLVRALFLRESIQTTEIKAKAIKGLVDRLITYSKKGTPAAKRQLESFLVDPESVDKLNTQIAPRYLDRVSGFTNLVKLGARVGDGAMMVQMSLIKKSQKEGPPEDSPTKPEKMVGKRQPRAKAKQ